MYLLGVGFQPPPAKHKLKERKLYTVPQVKGCCTHTPPPQLLF